MKQGCEIKKLGEVCTIKGRIGFRGYTRNDLVPQGEGAITLSPSNITNDVLLFDKCQYISWSKYEESPEIQIFEGDIIYAKTASVGKVALVKYLPEKATINPQFVVFKEILCNASYLYYAVRGVGFKHQISQITNGVAIPTVSQSNMANLRIPVPERAEQERIVGELDCLSGIIAAKRAQLRELDTLAQSIFYTMFGDPISNDKAWQTKALGNVCVVNPPKKDTLADVQSDDFVSFIPMEDLSVKAGYVKSKQQRLCKDVQSSYTCFADNDILMAKVTPCFENGKVGITQNLVNGIGFGSSEFIVIRPVNVIKEYVYFVIQTPIFIDEAVKRLTGTSGLRRVPRTYVEECIISIPPIDLQKQFAEKIENIERQKELITKSIKETEDLFNSRMDYYFN